MLTRYYIKIRSIYKAIAKGERRYPWSYALGTCRQAAPKDI